MPTWTHRIRSRCRRTARWKTPWITHWMADGMTRWTTQRGPHGANERLSTATKRAGPADGAPRTNTSPRTNRVIVSADHDRHRVSLCQLTVTVTACGGTTGSCDGRTQWLDGTPLARDDTMDGRQQWDDAADDTMDGAPGRRLASRAAGTSRPPAPWCRSAAARPPRDPGVPRTRTRAPAGRRP